MRDFIEGMATLVGTAIVYTFLGVVIVFLYCAKMVFWNGDDGFLTGYPRDEEDEG